MIRCKYVKNINVQGDLVPKSNILTFNVKCNISVILAVSKCLNQICFLRGKNHRWAIAIGTFQRIFNFTIISVDRF